MADLGPYLDYDGEDYECLLCNRYFASIASLYQHCKDTTYHEWCDPCRRAFVSIDTKRAHLRSGCTSRDQLYTPPPGPPLAASNLGPVRGHQVKAAHRCSDCGEEFTNDNNLRMHKKTHEPRDLPCYSRDCDRTFKKLFSMLIHLESGYCDSGMDEEEIEEIVDASYLVDRFLDEDGYFCLECEKEFDTFSGIYQHAEDTTSCSYLLSYPHCLARMNNQIRTRVH